MTILTENDWNAVSNALRNLQYIELDRTFLPTGTRIVVTVEPAKKPWTVAAVVKVVGYFRGGLWHQYFESVEAAKRAVLKWNGWL